MERKYTTNGTSVFCGKREIARSYISCSTGKYYVCILQGMPRMETADKILQDCPDFARENNLIGKVPGLFAPARKRKPRIFETNFKFV